MTYNNMLVFLSPEMPLNYAGGHGYCISLLNSEGVAIFYGTKKKACWRGTGKYYNIITSHALMYLVSNIMCSCIGNVEMSAAY